MIKRISYLVPTQILINLYYSLIYPYFTYCNFIWSSTYKIHLKSIQILQKKAIRVITKSPFNSHTGPFFLQYKLLNITQIKFLQTCEFMYKYTNNLLPPSFALFFCLSTNTHNTRSNDDYKCIFARTNIRKFSLKYQGPAAWNSLPKHIRTAMCLAHCKHLVRAHTLDHVL